MSRTLARILTVPLLAAALLSSATPTRAAVNDLSDAAGGGGDQIGSRAELGKPAPESKEVEILETTGRNIPAVLTAQRIEFYLTENFTTTRTGRLQVTKSMEYTATCTPTSGVIYFLMLDDVPIRNSAIFSRSGFLGQMSGVTTTAVPAGTHTLKVGAMCTVAGAYPSGASVTLIGLSSVIVFP